MVPLPSSRRLSGVILTLRSYLETRKLAGVPMGRTAADCTGRCGTAYAGRLVASSNDMIAISRRTMFVGLFSRAAGFSIRKLVKDEAGALMHWKSARAPLDSTTCCIVKLRTPNKVGEMRGLLRSARR
jgi:hypothetical protein